MSNSIRPKDFATPEYYEFAQQLLTRNFKYLSHGAFRYTFVRGNVVIKIPMNDHGINDNRTEALAYRKWKSHPTERGFDSGTMSFAS